MLHTHNTLPTVSRLSAYCNTSKCIFLDEATTFRFEKILIGVTNNQLSASLLSFHCIYTQHSAIRRHPTCITEILHSHISHEHTLETWHRRPRPVLPSISFAGRLLSEHTCLSFPGFTQKRLRLLSPARSERWGLIKRSAAFWVKPVWLCGLAGVTRVFPVSLHPEGLLPNMCVYFA